MTDYYVIVTLIKRNWILQPKSLYSEEEKKKEKKV